MSNNIDYYYNGKKVKNKAALPKGAKLRWTEYVHKKHYGNEDWNKQQDKNASKFFREMRETREDMEKYHG